MAKEEEIGLLCRRYRENGLAYCHKSGVRPGALIFKTPYATLLTWWDFDQRTSYGPYAYINDECVCEGHSTDHIIDYDVIKKSQRVDYPNGDRGYIFTMTITFSNGVHPCVFRCWEKGFEWTDVAPEHRAEVFGTSATVARFELIVQGGTKWILRYI